MAWLSGLADKAENLLNKIDQNTAAVLNKDKSDVPSNFLEVKTIQYNTKDNTTLSSVESLQYFPNIGSSENIPTTNLMNKDIDNTDGVSSFLNTSVIESTKGTTNLVDISPVSLSASTNNLPCTIDSVAEEQSHNGFTNPDFINTSIDINEDQKYSSNIDVIHSKEDFEVLPQECTYISKRDQANALLPEITVNIEEDGHATEIKDNSKERSVTLIEHDTDHQKQIILLNETIASLKNENSQLLNQMVDVQSTLEKSRSELTSMRFELEQHRARALKTLRDKEKLILELKSNTARDKDDVTMMELNHLRQEREILREENQQMCEQLGTVREELANADQKLEKMRQKFIEAGIQAQEIITMEKRKKLDAEEDAKSHLEEVRSLKDELSQQRSSFALQLQKQDSEISRLKMQLSTSSIPSSEVESRLANLTQTLVLKQQALEHLTTERNALRLQLEKIENEYRNYIGNFRRNSSYINPNDTDDVKAQIPTFLVETPFDTGVTRRVKRAYSTLDAISIRTGVFLRRYPLARILVLIYMALLQFWVLVVLLSQSPEAH